jgi:hypothetical protein
MTQFSQRAQYFSYLIWTSLTSNPEFIKKCPMGSGIGYDPITKNVKVFINDVVYFMTRWEVKDNQQTIVLMLSGPAGADMNLVIKYDEKIFKENFADFFINVTTALSSAPEEKIVSTPTPFHQPASTSNPSLHSGKRIEYLFSLIEKALTPMQSGSKSGAPSSKLLYDPVSFTFFLMVDAREFRIGSYEQNSENNNIALTLIGASGEERKLVIAYDPSRFNENFYQFSTELRSEYAHSPEMKTSNSFFKGIKRDITPSPTFQTQSQMNVPPQFPPSYPTMPWLSQQPIPVDLRHANHGEKHTHVPVQNTLCTPKNMAKMIQLTYDFEKFRQVAESMADGFPIDFGFSKDEAFKFAASMLQRAMDFGTYINTVLHTWSVSDVMAFFKELENVYGDAIGLITTYSIVDSLILSLVEKSFNELKERDQIDLYPTWVKTYLPRMGRSSGPKPWSNPARL